MKISGFLREIAIVVIGVLIAVSINNFKERLANEKYIQKTLSAIESEIEQSSSDIDRIMERHLKIIAYIEDNYENTEESIGDFVRKLGGIQSPSVKNISLRFFVSNKAELVSYDVISQLSEIETNKNMLASKMERLIDFASDHMDDTDADNKIKFAYHLLNVVDSEETLLTLYAAFIDDNASNLQQRAEVQ